MGGRRVSRLELLSSAQRPAGIVSALCFNVKRTQPSQVCMNEAVAVP